MIAQGNNLFVITLEMDLFITERNQHRMCGEKKISPETCGAPVEQAVAVVRRH